MKGPALSALALAAIAVNARAGESDGTNNWLSLDSELAKLASTVAPNAAGGIQTNAWIKTNFVHQDNDDPTPNSDGFQLNGVRITFSGDVAEGYKLKVSVDAATGTAVLKDAYAIVRVTDDINLTFGQYKAPFLFSATDADEKLLFYQRTTQGSLWTTRDPGAMLDGRWENFRVYVSAQNGGDGTLNDMFVDGKVAWDLVAGKGFTKQEGGYGPDSETLLTIAASVADEGTLSQGLLWAGEAEFATGPFFAMAEVVDYDTDFVAGSVPAGPAKNASGRANTTPWGLQAGWMLNSNWELAARYEDQDDSDNTKDFGAGVTYYVKGHDCKWQLNWRKFDSDNSAIDTSIIELGLTVVI